MSIAAAATRCLQVLNTCLEVEELKESGWAENRLADFNLWVAGTGALARSQLSLDARLSPKPDVSEIISNLLQLLAGEVEDCIKLEARETTNIATDPGDAGDLAECLDFLSTDDIPARPFSPWSDDSSSDGQEGEDEQPSLNNDNLQKRMQNIEMMLAQLAQIAVAIRRSSKRSRLQRADQLFNPEEHADLQTHLTTMILARGEFSQQMIDPSNLNEVQRRIVHCNLKRRNRFLYAQRHSKSLSTVAAARPSAKSTVDSIDITAKGIGIQDNKSALSVTKVPSDETKTPINPTIVSGTKASAISDSLALPHVALPAPAMSTIVSSTMIDIKYPKPPRIAKGAHVFTCPCCCQALPRALSQEMRWKKHIAEDLMPYSCILPGCPYPEVLYGTKKEWRQHLLNVHDGSEYWVCFPCGGTIQFSSIEAFVIHTKAEHGSSIPLSEIPLLTEVCRRSVPVEISACPLCKWPEGEEGEVNKNVLLDHIAKHLHDFSLRSLPWDDDNGQETQDRIDRSSARVYNWIIENNLSENATETRPSLELRVYLSSYFQKNLYFADDSESASSSDLESVTSWEVRLEQRELEREQEGWKLRELRERLKQLKQSDRKMFEYGFQKELGQLDYLKWLERLERLEWERLERLEQLEGDQLEREWLEELKRLFQGRVSQEQFEKNLEAFKPGKEPALWDYAFQLELLERKKLWKEKLKQGKEEMLKYLEQLEQLQRAK